MKKLLAFLVVVALVGGAGFFGYREMRPERRACRKLASLCERVDKSTAAEENSKSCESTFAELRDTSGPDSVDKPAQCILDSKTCPEATGCFVGGVGGGLIRGLGSEFLKGLGKSLGD